MKPTHRITADGLTFLVQQIRPGIGVDAAGQEHELFIRPGRQHYIIRRLGVKRKKPSKSDSVDDYDRAIRQLKDDLR